MTKNKIFDGGDDDHRVDGEESNLRLASWFSLSTSSQAIGRLPSPSTCSLRLALRLIKIDEIASFCILSSWCKIIQPAPSMKTRDKFCPLLKCQKMFLWNHLRLARFFWFFTSLGKKKWNHGILEKLKYCLRPTSTISGSFCFLVPPKEQLFPILPSSDFAFFHFSDIFK